MFNFAIQGDDHDLHKLKKNYSKNAFSTSNRVSRPSLFSENHMMEKAAHKLVNEAERPDQSDHQRMVYAKVLNAYLAPNKFKKAKQQATLE